MSSELVHLFKPPSEILLKKHICNLKNVKGNVTTYFSHMFGDALFCVMPITCIHSHLDSLPTIILPTPTSCGRINYPSPHPRVNLVMDHISSLNCQPLISSYI